MAGEHVWYELMTTDPDAASAFYGSLVGWTVSEPAPPELSGGQDYRVIERSNGGNTGGMMRLEPAMIEHGARPMWVGYLAVDDVDAAVAAIGADGGLVLMPPMDLPVGRMALVTDPQGAPFYVMKPVPPQDDPDAKADVFCETDPQYVRWNELMTSDPDAAIAFYGRHFGWTQEGGMPMGELGEYRFVQHGGKGIGAVMGLMPGAPASLWTYYIGVDDIDRAANAVLAGGGTVLQGPDEIPGGEFSLNGVDPQGAMFGLVGPRKA